jgi:predicted NBD/HSP70 family sugar kinase
MDPDRSRDRRIAPAFLRKRNYVTFTGNEKRLLNMLRHHGPLSRAEMARRSDLTMQSVVRLVDGLIERGMARAGDKVITGRGQPSRLIALVPDAAFAYGVSLMTDAVSMVLMDLSGEIRAASLVALDVSDRDRVIAAMKSDLARLAVEAAIDPGRVFGLGMAVAGYFVTDGALNTPASMGQWALLDLEETLANALDLPVWVENDGNAAAVGETLFGAGQRYRNFAYLYIAAGLGGGVVLDGQLMRGMRGNAGEFTGLLAPSERPNRPTLSLLLDLVRQRGVAVDGIAALVRDFDPAWPGVETWLERTHASNCAILSAIGAILDPEAIIVGGRAPPALARLLVERASYYSVPFRDHERIFPPVLVAEAGGDAAARGAAAIPLKEHFFG